MSFFISLEKPGKPDAPHIKSTTKKSVALTWSPPSYNGVSPITNYEIKDKADSQFKWTKTNAETVSETAYNITGLSTESKSSAPQPQIRRYWSTV